MTDLVPTQRPTGQLARQVAAYLHTLTPTVSVTDLATVAEPGDHTTRPSGGDTPAWICGLAVTVGAVTALGAAVTAQHHVLTTWL